MFRIGAIALSLVFIGTASSQTIHMYGPGGPLAPMEECAALFSSKTHVQVDVTAGPEKQWWTEDRGNADMSTAARSTC